MFIKNASVYGEPVSLKTRLQIESIYLCTQNKIVLYSILKVFAKTVNKHRSSKGPRVAQRERESTFIFYFDVPTLHAAVMFKEIEEYVFTKRLKKWKSQLKIRKTLRPIQFLNPLFNQINESTVKIPFQQIFFF